MAAKSSSSLLATLDGQLRSRTYVDGTATPTRADVRAYLDIGISPSSTVYPHVSRWFNHMSRFTASQRDAFSSSPNDALEVSHDRLVMVLGVSCPYTRDLIKTACEPYFTILDMPRPPPIPEETLIAMMAYAKARSECDERDEEWTGGPDPTPEAPPDPRNRVKWDKIALQWDEYEKVEWERVMSRRLVSNSYCVRKGLIRKAQLSFNLKKYATKNTKSILTRAIPETHLFEVDHPDYIEEALSDVPE
jgi:hypothetical protein